MNALVSHPEHQSWDKPVCHYSKWLHSPSNIRLKMSFRAVLLFYCSAIAKPYMCQLIHHPCLLLSIKPCEWVTTESPRVEVGDTVVLSHPYFKVTPTMTRSCMHRVSFYREIRSLSIVMSTVIGSLICCWGFLYWKTHFTGAWKLFAASHHMIHAHGCHDPPRSFSCVLRKGTIHEKAEHVPRSLLNSTSSKTWQMQLHVLDEKMPSQTQELA